MVSGMHNQRESLVAIVERCRAFGLRTVVGGPIASSLSPAGLKADHVGDRRSRRAPRLLAASHPSVRPRLCRNERTTRRCGTLIADVPADREFAAVPKWFPHAAKPLWLIDLQWQTLRSVPEYSRQWSPNQFEDSPVLMSTQWLAGMVARTGSG